MSPLVALPYLLTLGVILIFAALAPRKPKPIVAESGPIYVRFRAAEMPA